MEQVAEYLGVGRRPRGPHVPQVVAQRVLDELPALILVIDIVWRIVPRRLDFLHPAMVQGQMNSFASNSRRTGRVNQNNPLHGS